VLKLGGILVLSFFGYRLAKMFEPVFGLEYHLPSFMNSILTFQKKKTLVTIGFKSEKSWFFPFSDIGSQKCLNLYLDWNTICSLLRIQS